ncbi:MAG: hypothetical protein ABH840_02740 [Nanoarchaeota archaeon]
MKIPNSIVKLDKLFWTHHKKFKMEVNRINTIFELKKKNKFISNHPPTFFAGNVDSKEIKYLFLGLNPGFNEKKNKEEKEWRKNHRKRPLVDCKKLFELFGQKHWPRYFTNLLKLCKDFNDKNKKAEYCNKHVVSIDAFPFHSENNRIDLSVSTPEQIDTFFKYWNISKGLIKQIGAKYIFAVGKGNYKLLLLDPEIGYKNLKLVRRFKKEKGGYVHLYEFRLENKKGFMIDTFLGGANRSLTARDYNKIINNVKAVQK